VQDLWQTEMSLPEMTPIKVMEDFPKGKTKKTQPSETSQ